MRELLDRYVRAWQAADVDGLVSLLKADALFSMPPSPSWYRGRSAIRQFVSTTVFGADGMFQGTAAGRWRLSLTSANGEPAFAVYERQGPDEYRPFGIQVLTLDANALSQITCFIDPSLPARFHAR
jgi:RNA polymerase sigma-70 factor (ECF subfamily)